MYKNTPATASECFQVLDDHLTEISMEPDCVKLWQEFLILKEEEEAWDDLSAHEQYRLAHVPPRASSANRRTSTTFVAAPIEKSH